MGLRFILGRAGTGKTRRCLEEIVERLNRSPLGPPLVFLVPDQATYQLERELVLASPARGIVRAEVLSFRRLAHRVLASAGGAGRTYIDEAGKKMVLRRLVDELGGRLEVFGLMVGKDGFLDSLLDMFSEFKRYRAAPGELGENLPEGEGLLRGKLGELALLYDAYETRLAVSYIDPDDILTHLAGKIPDAGYLDGAEVWVDGFSSFTPQELEVLKGLMVKVKRLSVALSVDSRRLDVPAAEEHVFAPTRDTHRRLSELAAAAGVPLEQPLLLDGEGPPRRFAGHPDLAHLEEQLFSHPAEAFSGAPGSIRLVCASTRRSEVEAAAREMLRLSREEGWRWREMAVILRNPAAYENLVKTLFPDYGIPFFIDSKRPLINHPLPELVLSSLEVFTRDWAYEPLFRALKTDLFPVSRDSVDLLENYVLAHGIRGQAWRKGQPWEFTRRYSLEEDASPPPGEEALLEKINRIREEVRLPLLAFHNDLSSSETVRDFSASVYDYLEGLGVPSRLEGWAEEAREAGRLEEARQHAQAWDALVDLLDQLVAALGEERVSPDGYRRVLESGLKGLRLGLIPPELDQVMILALDRSRTPDIKAAFILGVLDGELPARPPEGGILNEDERSVLEEAGCDLAPAGSRRLLEEQYLLYTAFTRSKEYLWVSYPLAGDEGEALAPSMVVGRLKEIFPRLEESTAPPGPAPGDDPLPYLSTPRGTLPHLACRLRALRGGEPLEPVWLEAYNWYREHRPGDLGMVIRGVFGVNQEGPLPEDVCGQFFGSSIRTSVSALELYQACPFSYFLSRTLNLTERDVYRLESVDYGQFFHAVLREFVAGLMEGGLDLSDDEVAGIVGDIVDRLAPLLKGEILMSSARYQHVVAKVKEVLYRASLAVLDQIRRGDFRPGGLEVPFGPGEEMPALKVEMGDGRKVELRGRIDRYDVAEADGKTYVRVIDYKSGRKALDLAEAFEGLDLQLLSYLEVSSRGGELVPAGAFYFHVHNPMPSGSGAEGGNPRDRLLKEFRLKGVALADSNVIRMMDKDLEYGQSDIVQVGLKKDGGFHASSRVLTREEFAAMGRRLKEVIASAAADIATGKVEIRPYRDRDKKACRYCPYRPVCRFDPLLPENGYRSPVRLDLEEIHQKLKEDED